MTVSIRASLVIGAIALAAALTSRAAYGEPPAETLVGAPALPGAESGPADLCRSGREQSPVDLGHAIAASLPGPIFSWRAADGGMVANTGSTLEVNIGGAGGLTINGTYFTLEQIGFRHPAEHTIEGKTYPLEAHLISKAADGRQVIIAVLFEEGAANPALNAIWATAPARRGKAAVAFAVDPAKFLPEETGAYRYEGSMTGPPCSENVSWIVMAKLMTASHAQVEAFASLFPNNARPVQPLNRRFVLKTD